MRKPGSVVYEREHRIGVKRTLSKQTRCHALQWIPTLFTFDVRSKKEKVLSSLRSCIAWLHMWVEGAAGDDERASLRVPQCCQACKHQVRSCMPLYSFRPSVTCSWKDWQSLYAALLLCVSGAFHRHQKLYMLLFEVIHIYEKMPWKPEESIHAPIFPRFFKDTTKQRRFFLNISKLKGHSILYRAFTM